MKTYKHAFDSRDWNSIRKEIDLINEAGEMLFGRTTDDEQIIFDVIPVEDEDGVSHHDALQTTVRQTNGWFRINTYDPTDYTITEQYKKDR